MRPQPASVIPLPEVPKLHPDLADLCLRLSLRGATLEFRGAACEGAAEREFGASSRAQLQKFLYTHIYAACPALEKAAADALVPLGARHPDPEVFQALRAANPARGYLDPGWLVTRSLDGGWEVLKDGLFLWADDRDIADATLVETGQNVFLRFPPDAERLAPNFYFGFAEAGPARSGALKRIYLDLNLPRALEGELRQLLENLLALDTPYTYKVVADPRLFERRDNTVLYVDREHANKVLASLLSFSRCFPWLLRPEVPAFTLGIAPGIAIADEPPVGPMGPQSFGEYICHLVAEALITLLESCAEASPEDVLLAVASHLKSKGVDPGKPYGACIGLPGEEVFPYD